MLCHSFSIVYGLFMWLVCSCMCPWNFALQICMLCRAFFFTGILYAHSGIFSLWRVNLSFQFLRFLKTIIIQGDAIHCHLLLKAPRVKLSFQFLLATCKTFFAVPAGRPAGTCCNCRLLVESAMRGHGDWPLATEARLRCWGVLRRWRTSGMSGKWGCRRKASQVVAGHSATSWVR